MKFLYKQMHKKKKGFTLVETMVSVAIFTLIVTAGMGALMSVLGAYKYAQKGKKAADSVNVLLENMTREIRLGSTYYALPADIDNHPTVAADGSNVAPIDNGGLIGFYASDNRGYIIYYIKDGILYKKHFHENGSIDDNALTNINDVIVEGARITVMHTATVNDEMQPLVWIQLKVHVPDSNITKIIQTLVSQRKLDTPTSS